MTTSMLKINLFIAIINDTPTVILNTFLNISKKYSKAAIARLMIAVHVAATVLLPLYFFEIAFLFIA